jgi:hypothetical protein
MGVGKFTIGSLKKKVVFKKNTRGSLGAGSKDFFETFLTTKCSLEKKRAAKQNDRGQVEIAVWYKMICRFQLNLLNNINGQAICVIENVNYVIHDFDLIDEKKHLYEFTISRSKI